MAWFYLLVAGAGEVAGVLAINLYLRKRVVKRLIPIAVSFGTSFFFLSLALKGIPIGTAYSVWTGLGTAGAVLVGVLFFKESADWKRIIFLCCIIAGAAGLKGIQ